jgi:hypothetical protein
MAQEEVRAEADSTAVELELAIEFISYSDTLFCVSQSSMPMNMIHVLKASLIDLTRDCFLEITQRRHLMCSEQSEV